MQGKYWMKLIVLRRWLDLVANSVHFISKGRMVLKIFTFIVLPFYLVTPVDSFLFLLLTSSLIGSVFFLSTNLPFLLISYSPPSSLRPHSEIDDTRGGFSSVIWFNLVPNISLPFLVPFSFVCIWSWSQDFTVQTTLLSFRRRSLPLRLWQPERTLGHLTVDPKNYN